MVERFKFNLVLVCFLVLALSVKDLVFISSNSVEETNARSADAQPDLNAQSFTNDQKDQEEETDLENFDSNFGEEDFQKKIPSLKMKSNQQTIKFLYWYLF